MFSIDPMSRIPIYEQIIRQTEQRILSGLLPPAVSCRRCAACLWSCR